MFVSLLPGVITQGLSRALTPESFASPLYLFTFRWGSHIYRYLYVEGGILISCNFPCADMYGSDVWQAAGGGVGGTTTQMWILSSDRWRMGVKLTLKFTPIKCQVPYISGGHVVPTAESECESIICFFIFVAGIGSLSRWYELLLSKATIGMWKVRTPTRDLKWALI